MKELIQAIPDLDILLGLDPEDLGGKILFILKGRLEADTGGSGLFHIQSIINEIDGNRRSDQTGYPRNRMREIEQAITEAWCWLESQALLIPAPDQNGRSGFRILSRRALKFVDPHEFKSFQAAAQLPRDLIHEKIRHDVWKSFLHGQFDTAVFQAIRAVEIAIREAASFESDKYGVSMAKEAFKVDEGKGGPKGPLTDPSAPRGEQEAVRDLMAGAIGLFKNATSHRRLDLTDPREAIEIVVLASHLLRIIDGRRKLSP